MMIELGTRIRIHNPQGKRPGLEIFLLNDHRLWFSDRLVPEEIEILKLTAQDLDPIAQKLLNALVEVQNDVREDSLSMWARVEDAITDAHVAGYLSEVPAKGKS